MFEEWLPKWKAKTDKDKQTKWKKESDEMETEERRIKQQENKIHFVMLTFVVL